ncbi:MAG: type II toxin-antitoxin system prevent-host-death family antitoxin [Oscillatoriales cyanobacterium]|uniref:Antitoxin n=1 Tax=Microcoleus anatoxicus PTRS2 TaxID=2705321 RepID=A0ABU8YLU4_9CYAN|nr:MAG: type II toxin-antitoxin system prevent-host-death family antitoxin [Oscillatoriales cyanobacterium]TAD94086.1 MAG: type II toxin-antitoxin system prevent-host-death family antitoxin [Oscillatoriales cyanobacterium]TAE04672.1 MAG: type II toxin-antitoxin system prevent-host-death family antitoxin [Oscillatoriales cyanobacterium]TAF02935.1 MAG: type II toxin-antitoxin system prevent-host-death family antitoxin [Oscillatoriales cyanobacterium]TAF46273.1 MAG: type II toxin-antitoxin system 
MSTEITYTDAEANLENLCDRTVETGEVIVITRPNGKNAVLISEAELASLLETLYLLRSQTNTTPLFAALKRAKARVIQPQTLDEICKRFGLDEDDDTENEVATASDCLQTDRDLQLLDSINDAYADGLDPSEQAMLEGMRQHQRLFTETEW